MLIGRWNDTVPISYEGIFANAFFDFYTQAHHYWIFRPGSSCDTVNGNPSQAYFSLASGRTSFGPTTDPHPYLTDGTPEVSFEITDIQESGDYLTFYVHFLTEEVDVIQAGQFAVFPNPAVSQVTVTGEDIQRVELYNSLGQYIRTEQSSSGTECTLPMEQLTSGVYILKIFKNSGEVGVKKFVKK